MAKVIAPPQIDGLDGLLELVLTPAKAIQYMKDLQSMRDSIIELLGAYDTKEKASAILVEAQAQKKIVEERLLESKACQMDMEKHCATLKGTTETELAKSKNLLAARERELALRERTLAESQAALDSKRKDLESREAKLGTIQDGIARQHQELAAREAKHKKLAQTLQEAGV